MKATPLKQPPPPKPGPGRKCLTIPVPLLLMVRGKQISAAQLYAGLIIAIRAESNEVHGLSMTALGSLLGLTAESARRLVRGLENQGLLERVFAPHRNTASTYRLAGVLKQCSLSRCL